MAQKYAIGDKVNVVAPDPECPDNREYLGFSGEVVEYDPEAFGRLPYVIKGQFKSGEERALCFCEQELGHSSEE